MNVPCPVCATPMGGERDCAHCGWHLQRGYVLGGISVDVRQEYDAGLATARRRFDLRAVARVAAALADRDAGVLQRLGRLVRDGPPSAGELASAGEPDPAAFGIAPSMAQVMGALLARIVTGEVPSAAVVEIMPDSVVLYAVGADEIGVPQVFGQTRRWDWADLLPDAPRDRDSRLLRFAGGIGVGGIGIGIDGGASEGPFVPVDGFPAALRPVLGGLNEIDPTEVTVVQRVLGWPLLDEAGRVLVDLLTNRGPCAPLLAVASGNEAIQDFFQQVPLRYDYCLVVADVDPSTRHVRLLTRPLFRAGVTVTPGREPVAEIVVAVPPHRPAELALAVVSRPPGEQEKDPQRWHRVTIGQATLTSDSTARVRVTLQGPGRVRFIDPPGVRITDASWSEVLAQVPREFGADPVDIVFAVELAGADAVVAERVRLVADLLDLVEAEHPEPTAVRFGLVGYDDHDLLDWEQAQQPVVRTVPLAAAAGARDALRLWRPSEVRHDYAAPFEDALHVLGDFPWRVPATHILVTIGTRPPHPPEQGNDLTMPCPVRHNWKVDMDDFATRLGLRRVAVRGIPAFALSRAGGCAVSRAEAAWASLGADALLSAVGVSARDLAEVLGLLSGHDGQVMPLPLATSAEAASGGLTW